MSDEQKDEAAKAAETPATETAAEDVAAAARQPGADENRRDYKAGDLLTSICKGKTGGDQQWRCEKNAPDMRPVDFVPEKRANDRETQPHDREAETDADRAKLILGEPERKPKQIVGDRTVGAEDIAEQHPEFS